MKKENFKSRFLILLLGFLTLSLTQVWGGSYPITFLTNTGDGSTEIGTSTQVSTVVAETSGKYVSGFTSNCSKAYYKSINGVKLGTSKAAGTLEFNIASDYQAGIKKITLKSAKYGSDTGTLTLYSGSTSLKSGIKPGEDYTHTFTTPETVSSIKVTTSSKRAYVSEIILETESATITLNAGEHGAFEAYSDNTYDSSKKLTITDSKVSVDKNANVYLLAKADDGYEVDQWASSDFDLTDGADATKKSIVASKDGSVYVYFKEVVTTGYKVTLSQNTGGTIDATPKTGLAQGDLVTLSYNLTTGYTFGEWSVLDGSSQPVDVTDNKFNMPASDVTASATFNPIAVEEVQLKASTSIEVGSSETLIPTFDPSDALDKSLTWASDNETVATVENGVVTAKAVGTANITATSTNSKVGTCAVTVTEALPTITITAASIEDFAGSYAKRTWTADGVSGQCYAYRSGSSPNYLMQFNSTPYVYNTVAVPGKIKSVKIIKGGGQDKVWSVYVASSPLTSTTGGTQVGSAQTVSTDYTWEVPSNLSCSYFYITKGSGSTQISEFVITYEEVSSPVTFSSPEHGTLAIKKGNDAIATGDNIKMGTALTVTATPESGAYRLQAVKVIKTGADPEEDVTATVYKDGIITMPGYAITVSATMEANNYDVTFHSNTTPAQDDYTQTFTYTVAQNLTANTFTAPTGYEFFKWAESAEGEGTIADEAEYTLPSAADANLYAKWIPKTIGVTLDKNGSSADGYAAIDYDATAVGEIVHAAAWAAHTLKGYYTAATDGDMVITADGAFAGNVEGWIVEGKWAKTEDCTLYAQWESAENYNITYDLTGCTADAGNPTEIALSATTVTLNFNLASDIYTWTDALVGVTMGGSDLEDSEFTFASGKLVVTPNDGFKGDVEATIMCDYAPATLTLSENGSESTYGENLKVNDQVTLPGCAVECDKAFVGWSEKNADITASDILAVGASYALTATSNKLYAVFATETPGETTDVYTMNITKNTSNSAYATYYDVTFNSIGWKMPGNQASGDWVKLGGKFSTDSRYIYSKNAISSGVDKVVANHGVKDDAITVNSVTLDVYSTANLAAAGAAGDISSVAGTYVDNGNTTFERPSTANWTGRFYRLTYNLSSSASTSNKGIILYSVKMQSVAAPEYSDYTVTCTAKTAAPEFSLTAGEYNEAKELTITATEGTIHYTDNGDDPDEDSPVYSAAISLNTWGTKTIKAIAIADGKSASDMVSAAYFINLPFASLEDLVAEDVPHNTTITVSFENVPIKSVVTNYKSERVGVYFDIQKEEKDIEIYCAGVPEAWVAGGKLSKSNLTCAWKRYPETGTLNCWELTPSDWTGFTYTDPTHIDSIAISGDVENKYYSDGQTLDPTGLVVIGYYDDHTDLIPHKDTIKTNLTWTLPTLFEDQTSADVKVKYTEPILSKELTSEAYQVTGLSVSAAKVLDTIYVASDSKHKTEFFVGRPFSTAGLKVMAKYSIGDDEPITPTSISTPTMTSEGEQTITITYTENEVEKQTSYTITLAYMDLNDLVAATDIQKDDYVYVKITDQMIKSFYSSSGKNKGIFFDIQKDEKDIEIYANGTNCPSTWEQYGTVSATLDNVKWTIYNGTWELTPSDWNAFTYTEPNVPVTAMAVNPAEVEIAELSSTTLSIVYTPSYATNKGVTWAVTAGDEFASVDTDGKVTGLKAGSATITATLKADNTITATCAVTVTGVSKCTISYVVKGEEASTQEIARETATALTYVPASVSGHTFVGWAESDVTEETATPVTVITEYTAGAEEATKKLYAVYKYEDTSVEGYGNYNKITAAPADWSGKYLFVSETGNCAVKGSAIATSSLSHTPVTISEGVIAADDALLAEVLEVKKGTTNYTIKGSNGMYFTYNGTSNGFSAATTGAIEYPIAYDGTNKKTVITCPTSGGAPFQVNENTVSGAKVYTFKFYASSQKAVQLYKLVEGTFYYTSYPSTKYTVTFNADGGTGACTKIVVNAGESATICEDAPTKDLNKFNGWSDGTTTYAAGATIENINADIALTALWTAKIPYTITFDKNGAEGTAPESITDYEGNEVTLPTKGDLSYTGYIFKGWNDGETTYAGGAKFTMPEENVTMTAVWQDATVTHWALVINEKQLKAGDKVIIVASEANYALGAQNGTYRNAVEVQKSDDDKKYYVTTLENEPNTLIVGITDNKITFHDGNGYLYPSSTTANNIGVQEELDDNGKWNVSILNGVATILSVGNTVKPKMQFNGSANPKRFTCYGNNQGALAIYKYYETLPEYVERAMPTILGTNCIAQGGVEKYAFAGATFFEILDKDAAGKNVTLQEVDSLIAGMPYIIQPVAGADKVLMMVGGDEATAQSNNGLYGWLSNDFGFDNQIDSKDVYFVNGGKIKKCGTGCTLKTNRAYIVMDEISAGQSVAGRRRITLGVEETNTPTNVEMQNAQCTMQGVRKVIIDNQMFIIRGGKLYNASGALVK